METYPLRLAIKQLHRDHIHVVYAILNHHAWQRTHDHTILFITRHDTTRHDPLRNAHFLISVNTESTATGKEAGLPFSGVFPDATPISTLLGLRHTQVHIFALHLHMLACSHFFFVLPADALLSTPFTVTSSSLFLTHFISYLSTTPSSTHYLEWSKHQQSDSFYYIACGNSHDQLHSNYFRALT